jgi:hypothetical protein
MTFNLTDMDRLAFSLNCAEAMIVRKCESNPPFADLFALIGKRETGKSAANSAKL